MKHPRLIALTLLSLVLLAAAGCRKEYSRIKSSTRMFTSDLSYLERNAGTLLQRLNKQKSGGAGADSPAYRFTPMAQKNLINEYNYLYSALNISAPPTPSQDLRWDTLMRNFYYTDSFTRRLNGQVEVFGWHPYWMGENWKSYPYNLLTTISFYAYTIEPATGSYHNPEHIEMWRMIGMVDTAHARNCRVLLTVACNGYEQTATFLDNQNAWRTLMDSVSVLLNQKRADGIDLNFLDMPPEYRQTFIEFVKYVRTRLDVALADRQNYLALTLPAQNGDRTYDVAELQRYTDACIVQGFDYDNDEAASGAVSPMMSDVAGAPSLDNSIAVYTSQGLDPAKAILALPLYGAQWKAKMNKNGVYESNFDRKLTYREVKTLYNPVDTSYTLEMNLDEQAMTNYYYLEFRDSTSVECWFDDDFTIGRKMDLALSRNMRGVGLWALGYDQGYPEFWRLLRNKFSTDTVRVTDPVAAIKGYPLKVSNFFVRYADLLMTAAVLLALVVAIAMLIAFTDWRVRESMFNQELFFYVYLLFCTLLLVPLIGMLGFLDGSRLGNVIYFCSGIGVGYAVYRFTRAFDIRRP